MKEDDKWTEANIEYKALEKYYKRCFDIKTGVYHVFIVI